MAVSVYFGLPGCGKTTIACKIAYDEIKSGKYKDIYTNFGINLPGVTLIDNECIGKYELRDCLLLIDEATIFADSRDFKNFSKGRLAYFLLHRHRNADIILFTQQWDGIDRKIRTITDRVYYIKKGILLGKWFSSCYRIPYDIIIPDPKKHNGGEKLGEIIQGYCKPPLIARMFCKRVFRPKYYKYFDSWELEELPVLPTQYKAIPQDPLRPVSVFVWRNKRVILLRWDKKYKRKHKNKKQRKIVQYDYTGTLDPVSPIVQRV